MGSSPCEETELMKDSKYRVFVTNVDKALKSFEYSSDWPDLISALGKLNKVLVSNTKYSVIPRRLKIAKRLSQCLHPHLPSGVHLKALETYNIIFKCMGTRRLSQELFIYSAGLFPVLGFAAMNVRSDLLQMYEVHFVPLGERLGPALCGFLSGVLPGLEEGSDHYERTFSLLEKVCDGVGPRTFYGKLWECISTNSAVRLAAITYVLSHFDKRLSMEDQLHLMGTNVDVMVNGLCACVQDSTVLVQRSALDFLLVGFPMHNSQLVKSDMLKLVIASLVTVLRRDMSLNRRLFTWMLGSEVNPSSLNSDVLKSKASADSIGSSSGNQYFEIYSRELLVQAIKVILNEATGQNPHDLKPYKLLISLLDKPEIGPVILDDILYEVFRLLYLCHQSPGSSASNNGDLLKTANLMLSSLEPKYFWQYTGSMFSDACKRIAESSHCDNDDNVKLVGSAELTLVEVCKLTEFLLDTITLETYSETPSEHLPALFLHLVSALKDYCDHLSSSQTAISLQLCTKILTRVQPTLVTEAEEAIPIEENEDKDARGRLDTGIESMKSDYPSLKSDLSSGSVFNSEQSIDSVMTPEPESLSSNISTATLKNTSSVGDLNDFHDNESDIKLLPKRTNENSSITLGEPILHLSMEHCLNQYESFYVTFIQNVRRKINETAGINQLLDSLRIKSYQTTSEERAKVLEDLLRKVLFKLDDLDIHNYNVTDNGYGPMNILFEKQNIGTEWTQAVQLASKLLVELSTFLSSSANVSSNSALSESVLATISCEEVLPEWLQMLIVCACWLGNKAPSLQLATISTLLDLVTLCRTQVPAPIQPQSGVTPLILIPLLKPHHLAFLENQTNAFQVIAHWLWDHLGNPTFQVRCVELLHQLQSALYSSDVAENCIGEALLERNASESKRLMAFRRFSILWHVGREVTARMGTLHIGDIFYKSMLKMLDNLQLAENCPLKVEAQDWLLHSLMRGDVQRLLDPLIMMLLDPATARLSVLHAKISKPEEDDVIKEDTEVEDAKIYAISSIDGNVMYHVSEKYKEINKNNTNLNKNKKILAVTSLSSDSSNVTTEKKCVNQNIYQEGIDSYTTYSKNLSLLQNISVFVNPFSSDTSTSMMNNDFDDYFVEESKDNGNTSTGDLIGKAVRISSTDVTKTSKSSQDKEPERSKKVPFKLNKPNPNMIRNNSFSSLETVKNSLILNPSSVMISSADLARNITSISDTLFSKINDGKRENKENNSSISNEILPIIQPEDEENKNGDLVRSWSFSGKNSSNDLEESTPADEYFKESELPIQKEIELVLDDMCEYVEKHGGSDETVEGLSDSTSLKEKEETPSIKDSIESSVLTENAETTSLSNQSQSQSEDSPLPSNKNLQIRASTSATIGNGVDTVHSHVLLYCGVYDSLRTQYALQTIRNMIIPNSRAFLCAAATTGLAPRSPILKLLARHRKSLFGRGFHGDIESSGMTYSRSSMYLEVLISVCLYYIRSYYLNLGQAKLTLEEISGNRQVQIASVELLSVIWSELAGIVRDSGKGLSCYLADLLARCKVQKVTLHCILASVTDRSTKYKNPSFVQEIINFNDVDNDDSNNNSNLMSRHSLTLQIQLLKLLLSTIILEHEVNTKKGETEPPPLSSSDLSSEPKYHPNRIIPQQPMFICALQRALDSKPKLRWTHQHWTTMLTCALPYLGKSLTTVVKVSIKALCANIDLVADIYSMKNSQKVKMNIPADYAITQLEALTILCHYCLLDSAQPFNQPLHGTTSTAVPSQIFNNLVHVFIPSPVTEQSKDLTVEPLKSVRSVVLSSLKRILSSLVLLWESLMSREQRDNENSVAGSPRVVKGQLLELLSPIALHHGPNFLAAFAFVWKDRKSANINNNNISSSQSTPPSVLPLANDSQKTLVQLLNAIKAMPIDTLVQTIHQVVKSTTINMEPSMGIEVSVLELLLHYIQLTPGSQLSESWGSLLLLLREGPSLSAQSQFILLAILSQFVHRTTSPLPDKRDQKDLQDITAKLIESCACIAGACLEQTTWLRRNLAVKEEGVSMSITDGENDRFGTGNAQYSVQALSVLAQLLAPLLDVTYGSQEKERVNTLLTTLMYNVTPYLKNHSQRNVGSFYACSQLLANLSTYQYTRKAWKKDAMDLLLDPALFQMEVRALPAWKTIVDNLMSQEPASFRDLLTRVSLSQSNSLSLFSNKEQEYEQRAQLLKKLAFVILCSETDQFYKHIPEITEKLSESLKLPTSVPGVQAQVFLCFRVLLLRMSPSNVTSMWPNIVSEMVQVFLQMEQDLSMDTDDFNSGRITPPDNSTSPTSPLPNFKATSTVSNKSVLKKRWHRKSRNSNNYNVQSDATTAAVTPEIPTNVSELSKDSNARLSGLDWTWGMNSSNGIQPSGHPHWLQLQLAVVKLLDFAMNLPAERLPQFQMYRWAFVGSADLSITNESDSGQTVEDFVPHVTRIANLMDLKFGPCSTSSTKLPTGSTIKSLQDLHPFFSHLGLGFQDPTNTRSIGELEHDIEVDFLELLPLR